MGISVVNPLIPVGPSSMCWCSVNFFHLGEFLNLKNSSKIWLKISSIVFEGELKALDFI